MGNCYSSETLIQHQHNDLTEYQNDKIKAQKEIKQEIGNEAQNLEVSNLVINQEIKSKLEEKEYTDEDIQKQIQQSQFNLELKKKQIHSINNKAYTDDKMQDFLVDLDPNIIQQFEWLCQQHTSQKPFLDNEFPQTIESIGSSKFKNNWRFHNEIFKGKPSIFQGKIEPNDIKQGQLGDCYFLSALSALAENPKYISRIFQNDEVNEGGVFGVWLCISGEWKLIVLDGYFPCRGPNEGPLFSKANGDELWVLLLEKAYAKCYGNYMNIEAGITGRALRDLTGAPYEFIMADNPDVTWNFLVAVTIVQGKQKRRVDQFIFTAGSAQSDQGSEFQHQNGIVSGHAYSILDAQEIEDDNKKKYRLVQLRNPWGSHEWQGDWSDKSSLWNERIKKQLGFQSIDDGIFWMQIEDFCKQYSDITCTYSYEDYEYSQCKIDCSGGKNIFQIHFELKESTNAFISISQKDVRLFPGKNYDLALMSFVIYRVNGGNLEYVADESEAMRDTFIQKYLEKGVYSMVVEISDVNALSTDFVVSAYSDYIINWQKESLKYIDQEQKYQSLIQQIILKKPPQNAKSFYQYPNQKSVYRIKGKINTFVYYAYFNFQDSHHLREIGKVSKLRGLNLLESQEYSIKQDQQENDCYLFDVSIAPGESKIILLRQTATSKGNYGYSAGFTSQFIPLRSGGCM